MADHSEKYVFAVDVEMQMKKAAKQVADFEKQLVRVTKLPEKFKRAERKSLQDFVKGLEKSKRGVKDLQKSLLATSKEQTLMGRAARQQSKVVAKAFDEMKDASNELRAVINKNVRQQSDLERKIRKSTDAAEKKSLQARLERVQGKAKAEIDASRQVYAAKKRELDKGLKKSGALDTIKYQQAGAKKNADEFKKFQREALGAGKTLEDATAEAVQKMKYGLGDVAVEFATELADGVKEAVQALGSKDLGGVAKGLGKGLGKGMLAGMTGMAKWGDKNKDKGGITGMAAGGISSLMKSLGGVAKSLGPMMGMLAKMGPLLASSAAIVAGLVKVLLDAEAQAKQFNKDILESAGSADFLASAGGDINTAYKDLDRTLDDIRDHAFDASENMKWGINAKEHQAVLNVLNQEGVTLKSLQAGFKNAQNATEASAAAVQDWTDMTHMAVAFSRNFGVSLQEIGTMQGEMFTEMGASLSTVQLQFARMQKDASESGIATNKFFNIIRGVSSDLALYNTRLEETTTILKLLGKQMSPRNAQKFLQTMTRGMKDMSEEDRIKHALIAGEGKQREIVTKDLERKEKLAYADLARAAGMRLEEFQTAIKSGAMTVDDVIAKVPENARGAFKEAMSEMKMDRNALQKGGVVGLAEASGNLSAAGTFASKKAALQRFGGNKKLADMTGIQAFAARKVTGTSLEEFRAMAKMEAAIDDQKKAMSEAMKAVESGGGTADQKALVDRLNALDIKNVKDIETAGDAEIIAAMSKNDQEALAASQEQTNWAEKQANLTSSISDKMETIIEGIFEFLYVALKDVISDLNEFITLVASAFNKERPEKAARDSLRKNKTKDNAKIVEQMQRALADDSLGGDAKSKMISVLGPAMAEGMKRASGAQVDDDVRTVLAKGFQQDNNRAASIVSMGDTQIDKSKKDAFQAALEKDPNAGAYAAMRTAGFTQEDMKAFLSKSVWGMSTDELGRVAPNLQTVQAGSANMKNRPPSPQAEAAQKAAAPGTQGAPGAAAIASANDAGRIPPAAAATLANVQTSAPTPGTTTPVQKQGEQIIAGTEGIQQALRQDGIKIDKSFLNNAYEKSVYNGVLDAMRDALFEFALYTSKEPKQLIQRMQASGFKAGNMAAAFAADAKNASYLDANAVGGKVVGIAGGQAVIASPGEGLASVGKGETIVPAGGGSGSQTFQINVNGIGGQDLARYLQQRVAEIVYEYKRRERYS